MFKVNNIPPYSSVPTVNFENVITGWACEVRKISPHFNPF